MMRIRRYSPLVVASIFVFSLSRNGWCQFTGEAPTKEVAFDNVDRIADVPEKDLEAAIKDAYKGEGMTDAELNSAGVKDSIAKCLKSIADKKDVAATCPALVLTCNQRNAVLKKFIVELLPKDSKHPRNVESRVHESGHATTDKASVDFVVAQLNAMFAKADGDFQAFCKRKDKEIRAAVVAYEDKATETYHALYGANFEETVEKMSVLFDKGKKPDEKKVEHEFEKVIKEKAGDKDGKGAKDLTDDEKEKFIKQLTALRDKAVPDAEKAGEKAASDELKK